MTTIKSYTDIEQSKKLAEILPLESADMGWDVFVDNTTRILPIDDWDLSKNSGGNLKFYHAWSLAALMDVLDRGYYLKHHKDGHVKLIQKIKLSQVTIIIIQLMLVIK